MSIMNLGRVKGTQIYTGNKITGTSSQGSVFKTSGIAGACVGDLYINTDSFSEENKGNVYECSVAGDASVATWFYKGNIRGPKANVTNNLESTSTSEALSAYQGKKLWDTLVKAGVLARNVLVSTNTQVGSVVLKIDNINTTITLVVDGSRYTFPHIATGTSEETTVTISLASVGVPNGYGKLTSIESTNANIYHFKVRDPGAGGIYEREVNLWDSIIEAIENHEVTGSITEGNATTLTGYIYKYVDKVKKLIYPITHAKSVWFDRDKNKTVYDAIVESSFAKKTYVIDDVEINAYGIYKGVLEAQEKDWYFLGVQGWKIENATTSGKGVLNCNCCGINKSENGLELKIGNIGTSAAKIKIEITVLYLKKQLESIA